MASRRAAAVAVVGLAGLAAGAAAGGELRFEEISSRVGVDFVHADGRSGEKYYVETTASGAGWIDFDGDGDQDLYLLNGAPAPGQAAASGPWRNALYENRGDRFVDVTDAAGVGDTAFGMGLCAGDVDADGRLDFLVTNFGPDRLYLNRGDGRFEDVASKAGVAGDAWSSSCAFGDLDGDGDLDLYVTHYVDFSYEDNPLCGDAQRDLRYYCRPTEFSGVADSLFVNRGDGTFSEEGVSRGVARGRSEKGLGVLLHDLDRDGDLDIYVANDGEMNRLYANDGTGRFGDEGLSSGAGFNANGYPEAGMGVDAGDVDGDGLWDLVLTHFSMETNTLYRGRGGLRFDDVTERTGLAIPSFRSVGWGLRLFDADNDGDLDLAVANGHMQEGIEELEPGLAYPQPNQLYENVGDGRFRDVTEGAGPGWLGVKVSRGLAVADWNDDGRLDLLISNTNGRPDLLENRSSSDGHWLGLVLEGPAENPFAFGATAELSAGGKRQLRHVRSGGGFQSQSDLRLHFGLGGHVGEVTVRITWPDGEVQVETTDRLDRYWPIVYEGPEG